MDSPKRSPRDLIEIYWERVYNSGEVELIRDVCADPIIRHDPEFVTALSHDDQIVRVERSLKVKPLFTHQVLHADDRFVTSVWNMVSRDGRDMKLCGIEVFEAEDGRFTRCWNSAYMKGLWGEDGDFFDPDALAPPALVDDPGQITGDWFLRALAAGGVARPQRLATEPAVTPLGHGTTSTVVQIHASYNSGTLTSPSDTVCKIGATAGKSFDGIGPYERERRAYELFGAEPPFRVPRLYFGASDSEGRTNLLFEDLSTHARPGDQIAGCSRNEAEAAVSELGRFHRAYLARPEVLGLDWLSQRDGFLPAYGRGADVLREWLGGRITGADLDLIAAFGELAPAWVAIEPRHASLIHSDPRVDNVIFEDTEDGTRACLIDWQALASGDPQYDVAYFLSGSVTPENRRAWERDLVARHAGILAEALPGYTASEALCAYRGNVVSGLWMTVIAAAFAERNPHNEMLLTTLIERNTAVIRDWDALAAI